MINDWDDAYNNRDYCSNVDEIIETWASCARQFRQHQEDTGRASLSLSYGPAKRNVLDRFMPDRSPVGLAVFVHGGYWRAFDNSSFSHLAAGLLAHGLAVYMPSYTLAPEVGIADITREIVQAVEFVASDMEGPITLVGHSAGGHLVSRMVCEDIPLPHQVRSRIRKTISLSGVHDLRPLLNTAMNDDFKLEMNSAAQESSALQEPIPNCRISCVVGSDERPEFLRQTALLANIWTGLGADSEAVTIPNRNHFTLIDDLVEPDSTVTGIVVGN